MARLRWRSRKPVARAEGPVRRFLRDHRLVRDIVGALALVAVLLTLGATLAGGVWPPVLAVESGSMMHPTFETSYGRVGTIDVGDLVFIRSIGSMDDIELWVEGGEDHYGRPGDVIAYAQDGDHQNTTIIHRAITFVTVGVDEEGLPTYSFPWLDGETRTFGAAGIYFAPLGFDETWGFTPTRGFAPAYSGFVTKGDNAFSNPATDQAAGISRLIHPTWLVGEIHGELPWMGLAKLMIQSDKTNRAVPGWERIGNAFAPIELWSMFFLVLALVIVIPVAMATVRIVLRHRADRREREREEARLAARAAGPDASRGS